MTVAWYPSKGTPGDDCGPIGALYPHALPHLHPLHGHDAGRRGCGGRGVCERFPGLTVAFLEGNCSWAPWLLWRLDEHWETSGAYDHPDLKIAPSAYFRRQCYLSVECDEEPAEVVTRYGLEDRIVFSTDYPHADSKYPQSMNRFLRMPLSDETKHKFLWDNCARLYRLDG